jgi:phospholipid transport system substrate-binding protein
MRVRGRRGVVCALAFAALFITSAPSRAQDGDAAAFIAQLAEQAVAKLTAPNITQTERRDRFRQIFNESFDVKAIARFALGRYFRGASEAEQAEYYSLFEELMVQVYAVRFTQYAGETLRVTGTRPGPDGDQVVSSELVRTKGSPIQVRWRVHRDESGPKVNDIVVEGVSMILTHRDDFTAVIQRSNGKMEGLLASLRSKTAQSTAAN